MRSFILLQVLLVVMSGVSARAAELPVASADALVTALASVNPGDVIRVAPGTYTFADKIRINRNGTPEQPIVLRGDGVIGSVVFVITGQEGLYIPATDWVIEKIWLRCEGSSCEDAAGFSIKETARRITIQSVRTTNFYQHYKASMAGGAGAEDVTIQYSEAYNTAAFPGQTNAINLDGGRRWRVVGNYVHDFGNAGVSYGMYFKGGIRDSVMEQNLVVCSRDRPAGSDATLGISFGGGRMGVQYCAEDNRGANGCRCEDFAGIARNNIVANCPDAALHVNSACGSRFLNNIVYNAGVVLQVQSFEGTGPIEVRNNVLGGSLPSNNVVASDNMLNVSAPEFNGYYSNPMGLDFSAGTNSGPLAGAPALVDVTNDYCGNVRSAAPTRGAVELPAGCQTWPWGAALPSAEDAGVVVTQDAGSPVPDASVPQVDSGTALPDAAVPAMDSGVVQPLEDAGAQVVDAGAQVVDAGSSDAGGAGAVGCPGCSNADGSSAASVLLLLAALARGRLRRVATPTTTR